MAVYTLDSERAVIMIDLEVDENWKEVNDLMSKPANRERLLESTQQLREGKPLIHKTMQELRQYEQ